MQMVIVTVRPANLCRHRVDPVAEADDEGSRTALLRQG